MSTASISSSFSVVRAKSSALFKNSSRFELLYLAKNTKFATYTSTSFKLMISSSILLTKSSANSLEEFFKIKSTFSLSAILEIFEKNSSSVLIFLLHIISAKTSSPLLSPFSCSSFINFSAVSKSPFFMLKNIHLTLFFSERGTLSTV